MSTVIANSVLSGIGVVIDNMAKKGPDAGDPILDLINQIHEAEIPCLIYEAIPSENERSHFRNAAFILLDWELWESPDPEDTATGYALGGDELRRQGEDDNIAFLKSLRQVCFAPVFIFSHLAPEGIKDRLREAKLLCEAEDNSFILVRKKHDLMRSDDKPFKLLDDITAWITVTPSIYVLMHWNDEVARSQNRLFWDLYDQDPAWPSVLWRTYAADHDSPDHAIADVLLRNMRARMAPLALSPEHVVPESVPDPSTETLRAVLEASVMVSAEGSRLPVNQYGCGDIFKTEDDRGRPLYLLNIRCDCDCISRDGNPGKALLYLLKGQIVNDGQLARSDVFSDRTGFARDMNKSYVFPMDGGKCVAFKFKDLEQKTIATLSLEGATRIGRLTAPHITDIRQRYAQWLQREGFPKIPAVAVRAAQAGGS